LYGKEIVQGRAQTEFDNGTGLLHQALEGLQELDETTPEQDGVLPAHFDALEVRSEAVYIPGENGSHLGGRKKKH